MHILKTTFSALLALSAMLLVAHASVLPRVIEVEDDATVPGPHLFV